MSDAPGLEECGISDEEALSKAEALVTHLLGPDMRGVSRMGGGITNFVFAVDHGQGRFIVRMSPNAAKINDFLKEQWAMTKAREVGVPTPEVLEVGCEAGSLPYMVSRRVEGREATHHPELFKALREMGRLTALIHTVPTSGFGQTFDWSKNQLSRNESWRDYLRDELKVDARIETLEAGSFLPGHGIETLRAIFGEMETWTGSPSLNHGDMRMKNVLTDENGAVVAVIDWEFCTSTIAPYWDLSLALHDLSIDAKGEFLTGYGLSDGEVREMAPGLKALNIINYAPFVERASAVGDAARLQQYRTRLAGALDLFSL